MSANPIDELAYCALSRRRIADVSFNPKHGVSHDMTHTVEGESSVRNQKNTGTCWLQAGLEMFDAMARRRDPDWKRSSVAYLACWDKYEKAAVYLQRATADPSSEPRTDDVLRYISQGDRPIQEGGNWGMFCYLVSKYGVVPEDAFPATYQAENSRHMLWLITCHVRRCATLVRRDACTIQTCLCEIRTALFRCYGAPPSELLPEGTPERYWSTFGISLGDFVAIAHAPDRPLYRRYASFATNDVATAEQDVFFTVDVNEFASACRAAVEADEPVWFTADMDHDFDARAAVLGDSVYAAHRLLGLETAEADDPQTAKADRIRWANTAPQHAMLITGVHARGDDILAWRVQNSWGARRNDGFLTMTHGWFQAYCFMAVVRRTHLMERTQRFLERDLPTVKLPPWDIFSTVAQQRA